MTGWVNVQTEPVAFFPIPKDKRVSGGILRPPALIQAIFLRAVRPPLGALLLLLLRLELCGACSGLDVRLKRDERRRTETKGDERRARKFVRVLEQWYTTHSSSSSSSTLQHSSTPPHILLASLYSLTSLSLLSLISLPSLSLLSPFSLPSLSLLSPL